jgi:hypothetical protein
MRDVYRILPRRYEARGANLPTTSTASGPHTSIGSPLKAGFIEEGKSV